MTTVNEEISIEKGQRWYYNALNPFLISVKSLPPVWVGITVEWTDGVDVHYRKDTSPSKVEQTSVERFFDIAEFGPIPGAGDTEVDFFINMLYNYSVHPFNNGNAVQKDPRVDVPLTPQDTLLVGESYRTRSGCVRVVVKELSQKSIYQHRGYQFVDNAFVYHVGNGAATVFDEETPDDFVSHLVIKEE